MPSRAVRRGAALSGTEGGVGRLTTYIESDYPTHLLRLTEREPLDREPKAAERRIKEAGFPVVKTLDTFDSSAQPSIKPPPWITREQ